VVSNATADTTLLVIVHKENANSNATFKDLPLAPLEKLPTWLIEEEISWYGWPKTEGASEWNYYCVGDEIIGKLASSFIDAFDLNTKALKLSRKNRDTGADENVQIFIDAPWIDAFDGEALNERLKAPMVLPVPNELDYSKYHT
jgi:hypothetical protein